MEKTDILNKDSLQKVRRSSVLIQNPFRSTTSKQRLLEVDLITDLGNNNIETKQSRSRSAFKNVSSDNILFQCRRVYERGTGKLRNKSRLKLLFYKHKEELLNRKGKAYDDFTNEISK